MTNKKIATNVAKRLVKYLTSLGCDCKCDYSYKPIRETLRNSWYVKKVLEIGHTDCIFIDVDFDGFGMGFFAVLENGEIMTGENCMIKCPFSNLPIEMGNFNCYYFENYFKVFAYDDFFEDVLVISTLDSAIKFFERVRQDLKEDVA